MIRLWHKQRLLLYISFKENPFAFWTMCCVPWRGDRLYWVMSYRKGASMTTCRTVDGLLAVLGIIVKCKLTIEG